MFISELLRENQNKEYLTIDENGLMTIWNEDLSEIIYNKTVEIAGN